MTGADDPVGRIDVLVTAIAPGVAAPGGYRRDAVLVTGPPLAGVSAVAAALRDRLPGRVVVEELPAGETPTVVVFVVSAAAALTESDCALLDAAVAHTDAVIGAVSKIEAHRQWPEMLHVARDTVTARAPRYRDMPWVAVSAEPPLGQPNLDALVTEVNRQLLSADLRWRNRAREWEVQLRALAHQYQADADAADRQARLAALQERRGSLLRRQRLSRSERTAALRGRMAAARLQLTYVARNRCNSLRGELHEYAAAMTRHRLGEFDAYVRRRIDQVIADVDRSIAAQLDCIAGELTLVPDDPPVSTAAPAVEIGKPPLRSRRLETQLTMLVGVGFGLGVALTLSRLCADLTMGLTAAGAVACAVVGLAAAVWMVSTRGLLHDRAVLDRWVTEASLVLRCAAEERVALHALAIETSLMAALAKQHEAEDTRIAGQIAVLDHELRRYAAAGARVAALRDQQLPALQRALAAVRIELGQTG